VAGGKRQTEEQEYSRNGYYWYGHGLGLWKHHPDGQGVHDGFSSPLGRRYLGYADTRSRSRIADLHETVVAERQAA
jgi:hypothetical protein